MQFANRFLSLAQPRVMGILNVTPDSFYDGGQCYVGGALNRGVVLKKVEQMVSDGADFIDVGGESTRPGAEPVSEQEECDRVLPVVEAIAKEFDVVVSVDTSTAELMRQSALVGAGLINDVRALTRHGAISAAVDSGLPVCLMHMKGSPQSMQNQPAYQDAVEDVFQYLKGRKSACLTAGIAENQIIVDPGIGFGKTDEHNLALIAQLNRFNRLAPTLLGVSRKSMFGRLLGRPLDERLPGSLAAAARALQQKVGILRVHDVAETQDLIRIWQMTECE